MLPIQITAVSALALTIVDHCAREPENLFTHARGGSQPAICTKPMMRSIQHNTRMRNHNTLQVIK